MPPILHRHDASVAARIASAAKGGRKRIDPATCVKDYDEAELEFLKAMDRFKRNGHPYPTCRDVLALALAMGYRKVEAVAALPGMGEATERQEVQS